MVKFDKDLYVEIGKQLKEARLRKGMSLQDVSDAIGGDKTKQTIMRYENGTTRVETELLKRICNVLSLDSQEVMDTATYNKLMNTHYEVHVRYDAKDIPFPKGKIVPVQTAYEMADEKTKRAVRVLLGIDE